MSSEAVENPERLAIGISFGNSYSSIACTIAGDAKVIANEEGDRQIPTALSYVEGEEFHGTQAKLQLVRNSKNTCAYFRDFIGKNFGSIDPTPCHHAAHPQALGDTIAFLLQDSADAEPSTVSVSEVTTRHLRRLKNSAADYIGKPVTAAVFTVPTDFTTSQKEALSESAKAAGIEVLQFIPEPVAALLAQVRKSAASGKPADKTIIVADLGGSRSDIAVISIRGGMYSVLATVHDYDLGGNRLDSILVDHFAKEFQKKHKSDPRSNQRSLAKLVLESEACKKALSLGASAGFNVESLDNGIDFSSTINRSRYELLAGKTLASFTRFIEGAVSKAELDPLDIDEILLCGGTAHTPRIASNVKLHFPETTLLISPATDSSAINPSELAVRGAALQAFLIEGFETEDIEQSTHPMVTVTPHLSKAIGVVVTDTDNATNFLPVILAETPLPVRRTMTFTHSGDTGALIRVCEGLRSIKVTKPDPKPKMNGQSNRTGKRDNADDGEDDDDDDDDDDADDDDDDEDDEEETRQKIWQIGGALAELALRDVKPGSRVTLQINVSTDLDVTISSMEVGGISKPGIKGSTGPGSVVNGSAH